MFYINWYPGTPTNLKRSASGGKANEGSPPKRPREECELEVIGMRGPPPKGHVKNVS